MLRVFGVIPENGSLGFPVTQAGTRDEVSLVLWQVLYSRQSAHWRSLEVRFVFATVCAGDSCNAIPDSTGRLQGRC